MVFTWYAQKTVCFIHCRFVQVSTIPYLKSFQSYIASSSKFGAESYETAPVPVDDDDVTADGDGDGVQLYPPQLCPDSIATADKMENITLEEFILSFQQRQPENGTAGALFGTAAAKRGNKKYIFSQLFSSQNPTLMRIASHVYEWAMGNIGISSLFEVWLWL